MKNVEIMLCCAVGALAIPGCSNGAKEPTRPNIILIMSDDMGFSDLGCYGGEIETPNLDALSENGIRWTQFYNMARCCPSRAALLTGLYPHRAGMGWMTVRDMGYPGYRGELNTYCVTIPEVLQSQGYKNYMTGKWHLTADKNTAPDAADRGSWPLQRGFDKFFGTLLGAGSFWTPNSLTHGNDPVTEFAEGFYYTDAINDTAAVFIANHMKNHSDSPFFLYVSHVAPHWPLHARQEDIDKYRGWYDDGFEPLRQERYRRMLDLGVIDDRWNLTPRDMNALEWDALPDERKRNLSLRMAIYAAQVDVMDQGIGRIVDQLKEHGIYENTLIMFVNDNGAAAEDSNRPLRGRMGSDDSWNSYGLSWANVSNTPLREYKHWTHEGGISTPFIVHWPTGMSNSVKGSFWNKPGHFIDVMATFIELTGAEYPKIYNGSEIFPYAGQSFLSVITDGVDNDRGIMFWEHQGSIAVRDGKWKLVAKGIPYDPGFGDLELYNLDADPTEMNNLAVRYPEKLESMFNKWDEWAKENWVYPIDGNMNWGYRLERYDP